MCIQTFSLEWWSSMMCETIKFATQQGSKMYKKNDEKCLKKHRKINVCYLNFHMYLFWYIVVPVWKFWSHCSSRNPNIFIFSMSDIFIDCTIACKFTVQSLWAFLNNINEKNINRVLSLLPHSWLVYVFHDTSVI